ncbi:hypothetical protein [Terricaulis sp.]|uniref:hypothetical protein n=1 Tax=Terricaulis sp. TaxID=2768686 RepID=UPI003784EDFC
MRRAGVLAIALALVLISAGVGIVWLALAAHDWLARMMGPAPAALWVGAVLILPFLVLVLVHMISAAAERRAHVQAAEHLARLDRDRPRQLAGHAIEQIQHIFRERPMLALVITLAAGAVIARYPAAAVGMVKLLGRTAR